MCVWINTDWVMIKKNAKFTENISDLKSVPKIAVFGEALLQPHTFSVILFSNRLTTRLMS